ncbi:MAG: GNAT family N-acetyltransferase [Moraxellaceae bacterium]|nr:GNAT family N-acetyltransferase [Moraxellaceae bacterium]
MPTDTRTYLSRLCDAPAGLLGAAGSHPFLQAAFLMALEDSGAAGPGARWQPCHLLLEREGAPLALLPLYRKQDSRGEYVFDHDWASAWERHGHAYFPKLVTAVPFTPVPGPRLLCAPGVAMDTAIAAVLAALPEVIREQGVSGWHGLFVEAPWLAPARAAGFAVRTGCRFHWENPGWADFDAYLAALTSKKRKDIRRERRLLNEAGVRCRRLQGHEITAADMDFFATCYARTYHEHGQAPYLPAAFFQQLRLTMPEQLLLVIASDDPGDMASALFFHDGQTLFGRYWGALRRADGLHFEVCYYQGMEFCLHEGLTDFDPGTQGEHKLLRGFHPQLTHSLHLMQDSSFQSAIARYVSEESVGVMRYCEEAQGYLPYRKADEQGIAVPDADTAVSDSPH